MCSGEVGGRGWSVAGIQRLSNLLRVAPVKHAGGTRPEVNTRGFCTSLVSGGINDEAEATATISSATCIGLLKKHLKDQLIQQKVSEQLSFSLSPTLILFNRHAHSNAILTARYSRVRSQYRLPLPYGSRP